MAEYRLGPRAQRDLDALFDHTVSHWDLAQALRYTERVEATCAQLADAPLRAQACDHICQGYRRRTVQQHVIYLRPTSYGIAIIRILHHRMEAVRHL